MPNADTSHIRPKAPQEAGHRFSYDGSVAGPFFRTLLEAIESLGIERQAIAQALSCSVDTLSAIANQMPQSQYLALLTAGQKLSQDPVFGLHIGQRVHTSTYTVLGYTLMSCHTLGQALQQVLRFEGLVHDFGSSSISISDQGVIYQWHNHFRHTQWEQVLNESTFAGLLTFAQKLAGKPIPLRSVAFTHAQPTNSKPYETLFKAPLSFSSDTNQLCFPGYLANWPIIRADTSLFTILEKHAQHQINVKASLTGFIGNVKRVLMRNLPRQETQLPQIANELNLTPRTLQRKLQKSGTTYQSVLDDVRFEQAKYYLQHSSLSLLEITFILGFQAQSSFNHAFKEWSGLSPQVFRDQKKEPGQTIIS